MVVLTSRTGRVEGFVGRMSDAGTNDATGTHGSRVGFGYDARPARTRARVGDVDLPPAVRIAQAYKIDLNFAAVIVQTAARLGANPYLLANLIRAESNFDPQARNPSGATGLIQFMPRTASEQLGTTTDAIYRLNAIQQMPWVEKYLAQYKPLDSAQRLYLAVFYPKAQSWPPTQEFPEAAWRNNPWRGSPSGYIKTPENYVAFVNSMAKLNADGSVRGAASIVVSKATEAATEVTTTVRKRPEAVAAGVAGGTVLLGVALLGLAGAIYVYTR